MWGNPWGKGGGSKGKSPKGRGGNFHKGKGDTQRANPQGGNQILAPPPQHGNVILASPRSGGNSGGNSLGNWGGNSGRLQYLPPPSQRMRYPPTQSFFDDLARALGDTDGSWRSWTIHDVMGGPAGPPAGSPPQMERKANVSKVSASESVAPPTIGFSADDSALLDQLAATAAQVAADKARKKETNDDDEVEEVRYDGVNQLSEKGKAKIREAINNATSIEELTELDEALNSGDLDEDSDLIKSLGLTADDFLTTDSKQAAENAVKRPIASSPGSSDHDAEPASSSKSKSDLPEGDGSIPLSTYHIQIVKSKIDEVETIEELEELEQVLQAGTVDLSLARRLGIVAETIVIGGNEEDSAEGNSYNDGSNTIGKETIPDESRDGLDEKGRNQQILQAVMKANYLVGELEKDEEDPEESFDDVEDAEWDADEYDPFKEDPFEDEMDDDLEDIDEFVPTQDAGPATKRPRIGSGDATTPRSLQTPKKNRAAPKLNNIGVPMEGAANTPHKGERTPGKASTLSKTPRATVKTQYASNKQSTQDVDEDDEVSTKPRRDPNAKRVKPIVNSQFWKQWTTVMRRTRKHPHFQRWITPPHGVPLPRGWRRAEEPVLTEADKRETCRVLSISTSTIYVGDIRKGFDPKHLARVTVIDQDEKVQLDLLVRPQLPVLDMRTHMTGLTEEDLRQKGVSPHEARKQLSELLSDEQSILVGHCIHEDAMALRLAFSIYIVDTALLFENQGRPNSSHSLRTLSEEILDIEEATTWDGPNDTFERCEMILKIAKSEAERESMTALSFSARAYPNILKINHIPQEMPTKHLGVLFPKHTTAAMSKIVWRLNENDPSDWRGECFVLFETEQHRNKAFDALQKTVDVFIGWGDKQNKQNKDPDEVELVNLLTEQAIITSFSVYGRCVGARIPRHAYTNLPLDFGFASFLSEADAKAAIKERNNTIRVTPQFEISCRAQPSRGGENDKRVPLFLDPDDPAGDVDWLHIMRRV